MKAGRATGRRALGGRSRIGGSGGLLGKLGEELADRAGLLPASFEAGHGGAVEAEIVGHLLLAPAARAAQ